VKQETRRIPLAGPLIDERDEELVLEVLRSGWLSLGPTGPRFEGAFADYVGARHAAAVSSGTAGLHLCMRLAGVGAGDEVITSPYSFAASANCAIYEVRPRSSPISTRGR
jgi:perosamine synthetase